MWLRTGTSVTPRISGHLPINPFWMVGLGILLGAGHFLAVVPGMLGSQCSPGEGREEKSRQRIAFSSCASTASGRENSSLPIAWRLEPCRRSSRIVDRYGGFYHRLDTVVAFQARRIAAPSMARGYRTSSSKEARADPPWCGSCLR